MTLTADITEWRSRWTPRNVEPWEATPGALAVHVTRDWAEGSRQRQAPHLELIDDAYRRISEGSLKRLIIEMPPRHGKTERTSRWGALWYLRRHPDRRVILASYGAELAEEHSQWVRDVIESQNGTEDTLDLGLRVNPSKRAINRWQLLPRYGVTPGGMIAAGVGGTITGRGADLFIIDDPVKNREEADSPTMRKKVWDWWTSTARTRLQPGGAVIVIMTRWHEEDLVGRLISGDDEENPTWERIRLPALAEEKDAIGRSAGEALWPEQYPLDALEAIRRDVGSRDWLALYQQRPTAPEGAIWRWKWITDGEVKFGDVPPMHRTVVSVDPQGTNKPTSDETGIVVVGQGVDHHGYVLDDLTMKGTPNEWGERVWKAALDYEAAHIILEDNQGQDMAENVLRMTWPALAPLFARAGLSPPRIERVTARASKYTRAVSVSALYESTAMSKPRMHHVRGLVDLSLLEDELTGWVGTGDSPNRLDALCHGARWLFLGGDKQQSKQGRVVQGQRWARKGGYR